MGQYFKAVILAPTADKPEIEASFRAGDYNNGAKQMEHAWSRNDYVSIVEKHFVRSGKYYKHRLVWAGDYADSEPACKANLYTLSKPYEIKNDRIKLAPAYRYIVNHTTRQWVDKKALPLKNGWRIHPLPLLTAEGNEGAGGEYNEQYPDYHLIGTWARHIISVEKEIPEDYEELKVGFIETAKVIEQ